nr:pyridoxamine 5'-phosphate oxidase family protein [uncultured Oscillibacter sp.]
MRRKDREVTDPERIDEIIFDCQCCRLGLCDQGKAYIVPLNVGFVREDGNRVLYFHSAKEGRKIDLIARTGWASFEMDSGYELVAGDVACRYSARYRCVMGGGPVSFVETAAEKRAGLTAIMRQTTGRDQWTFSDAMLDAVRVIRLNVEELSCKERL